MRSETLLAGEEVVDEVGGEEQRLSAVLQPRLRSPLGEELGERVDRDGHRAGAAVKFRLGDQRVNSVIGAIGARIAHVAHGGEQRAGGVDIGVVDPVAVDADQRRRGPDARSGPAQADKHLVVDAQNAPVPGVADPHRAVRETVQLLGMEATFFQPSQIDPPTRTAEIEHDQIRTIPALGHLHAPHPRRIGLEGRRSRPAGDFVAQSVARRGSAGKARVARLTSGRAASL